MPSIINATTTNGLVTSADNSGELRLQTNSGTNAITIGTTQNVAVGSTDTTNSGGKLIVVPTNTTGSSVYQALDCTNYVDSNFQVNITGSTSTDKRAVVGTTTNTPVAFVTASSERMRIDNGGNVLIGTTSRIASTNAPLHVYANGGSAIVSQQIVNTADNLSLWNSANDANNVFVGFYTNTPLATRGSISYNRAGGLISYNTTSDYRSKNILGVVDNALASVANLKVHRAIMKGATQERPMFVAHELQEEAPYAVIGEKDAVNEENNPIYQQVDVSSLVPLLAKAIQELNAKVDAQAAEIQALKGVA